jgi:hypothetical protein
LKFKSLHTYSLLGITKYDQHLISTGTYVLNMLHQDGSRGDSLVQNEDALWLSTTLLIHGRTWVTFTNPDGALRWQLLVVTKLLMPTSVILPSILVSNGPPLSP